ncbi:zinc knuckle transcription factor splicing factor msl5 [Fusarium oxysporum f. sp. phaseoli]
MTSEQLDAYIMGFRIAEITDQLRTNDLNHTSGTSTRCLSPTPEYDNTGRRTNSRKQRYPYRPPYDYRWKRETFTDKIYLPVADFPYVPFIGQILWPRGSSLKAINDQSGANVVTRGKGNRDSPSHCQRLQRTPSLFDHCGLTIQSRPSQKGHSRRDCNSHYDTGSRQ